MKEWLGREEHPPKAFFNSRGKQYRELGLKDRLPQLSAEEQIKLLASDGLLIRRPILVGQDLLLIGFQEETWSTALLPD